MVTTITTLRLPFQIVEHREFRNLLNLAQSSKSTLPIPSRKVIRSRIRMKAQDQQTEVLHTLPPDTKLSISLDCWTSPFQQAFMAITGYFIDSNWQYREVLLGFEPLSGKHSGINLSAVVLEILQRYNIQDRILAITTDNASNNSKLVSALDESIQSLSLDPETTVIRVPCMAHVIQLSLKQLLGQMKANPANEAIEMVWSEERRHTARQAAQRHDIANTLTKV